MQLLKGLWSAKFDVDKSIDYLLDAAVDFEHVTESEVNYFSINCYLEIGNNYLKKDNKELCLGFLAQAKDGLIELFGEDHALIQKYYSYASEYASHVDD